MNKPSERIVVFVTTAQKRAITSTAENLGISVSELMRRAVLSFGATSEQVKAASIVDRLRAPRAPDALDAALQRVARGTRYARAALPAALQTRVDGAPAEAAGADSTGSMGHERSSRAPDALPRAPGGEPAPLLPAGLAAALAAEADLEAAATAEAVARVAEAKAAAEKASAPQPSEMDTPLRNVLKRPRIDKPRDDDEPSGDPSTEGGRFA
ncbi:hypothetical protein [Paraburkholderia fynbosensis]|uniref:Uncharacterized protein n=1 Tax=Paraburkholderia fynbosensis TaxID=1200993 RepID=A0A6J5GYX5_9BURK|nr:hypothetical protein [Paraburkholderia fynbosensis]CAB3808308.1 hypothetical protein LMG27177_06526 [Paraburkholderia fynbosensis]